MTKLICAIHQPHYVPWLRYFDKVARGDVFVALDDAQFNKSGWQNRNKLKGPGGWFYLTVPVVHDGLPPVHEVAIDNRHDWARKHWRSIATHYGRSACFKAYADELETFYAQRWERLVDLDLAMLRFFLSALGITTPVVRSSEMGIPGGGTERLARICRAVGATHYLTGAYAVDVYLSLDVLRSEGIEPILQDWKSPQYRQLYPEVDFIPDLSILDLLLNHGKDSRSILLRKEVCL